MPVIKVRDLAYGRLSAPDLDAEEEFLTAFGMVRAERTPTALYMRGTDPARHIHITEKGDAKVHGFAWYVEDEDSLKTLSKFPGASGIEHLDEPGGTSRRAVHRRYPVPVHRRTDQPARTAYSSRHPG